MKSPKQPKPSAEEKFAQQRQSEELTRLDEEENKRIKRIKRGSTPMGGQRAAPASQGARVTRRTISGQDGGVSSRVVGAVMR